MSDTKNGEVLLRVENLCQYFRMNGKELKAVDDVSFEIRKGEVFGLVGESGCGKTTTGRSIIRIYDITSGSIYFKGRRICAGERKYKEAVKEAKKEIARLKKEGGNGERIEELRREILKNHVESRRARIDHRRSDQLYADQQAEQVREAYREKFGNAKNQPTLLAELRKSFRNVLRTAKNARLITKIQMIFQDPVASLNPRMTVREIIAEGLILSGIKDREYIDRRVCEILEMVGLVREHAGRYPHEFSGGQRQRIGIARAVIMNPELLIADEPVSALDVSVQAQVINLLNELRERLGLTILFIAHDLSVVKYFSDRIGVMYCGKMVELADSDELFAHPMHPYTRSLLSAIPLPDPHAEKKRVRIPYHASACHDYSSEKPSMREITPGHFVYCSNSEERKYREEAGL